MTSAGLVLPEDLLAGEELAYLRRGAGARRRAPRRSRTGSTRACARRSGSTQLYAHQREAWDAAARGEHVVVTTGTASGKTLAFNLPVLDALAREPKSRALYLYPTKALAQDQFRALARLPRSRASGRRSTTATRRPSGAGRSASGRT